MLSLRLTYRPLQSSEEGDVKLPLDQYGFEVALRHVVAFRDVRRSTARDGTMWLAQWNSMLRRSKATASLPAEASSLARSLYGRVPLQHRPHLWLSLTGAREMMMKSQLSYWQIADMAEGLSVDPAIIKQIDSDLPRTFPGHQGFAQEATGLRAALRRVLVAYAAYNVSVGYCQSLNFIAAVFLLVADEEGAFWLLAALCKSVVADYHTHEMSGLRTDTALFATLVRTALPQIHNHFCDLEVPIEILASQWWLCLYANVLPTATLMRTWDVVLSGGGVDTLVASALAILRKYAPSLCAAEDIAGVYAVLAEATPSLWDPDELMLTMQQTLTALDATGSKRVELQKEREAKRRTQLEQAIDGTAYTPADLAQVLEAIVHGEGSSAPLKLADANRGDEEAEEEVALKEVAAPSSAAAASLCTTCLERYLGARDLAALLLTPGPHLSTLGLAVTEEAEGASQAARYQAAEKLFALLDVEGAGVLSARQILSALSGTPTALQVNGEPSEEAAKALREVGLEIRR